MGSAPEGQTALWLQMCVGPSMSPCGHGRAHGAFAGVDAEQKWAGQIVQRKTQGA